MARLVPLVSGRHLTSAAEKKLAERFRTQTPEDWVLMHSVGFVRHATKRWAEADFVLVCTHGVLCLEVKGGRVSCVDGIWSFTDRTGHVNTKGEGPFDQAGSAAGALQAWLAEHDVRRADGSRFQVGYGVMTPDCLLEVESPSIDGDVLFDQRDAGRSLQAWIEELGGYWQKRQTSGALSAAEVSQLADAIRPSFEAKSTPYLEMGRIAAQFVRLTEEQLAAMNGLADNDRVVVSGAAGTGKTLLALEEARRLKATGRVLVVCFSDRLAESLALQLSDSAHVMAVSVDGLSRWVIEECDAADRLEDAEETYLRGRFRPELATRLFKEQAELSFDAIVVDEAQDLRTEEFCSLLDAAVVGGFSEGTWRLFQDPNQNLFGRAERPALDLIGSGSPAKYSLHKNCRNTMQIVHCAELLSEAHVTADSQVHGPEVQTCQRWDDDILERVADHVDTLVKEGIPSEEITVLATKPGDLRRLPKRVRAIAPDVTVLPIGDFKGLESNVIVLVANRDLDAAAHRQAMYVGTTRARVRLIVVIPGQAKYRYDEMVKRFARRRVQQVADD